MPEKFTGAHTLESGASFSVQMAGQPTRAVIVPAGDWYVGSGDASDLLAEIEGDLTVYPEFSGLAFALDSDGVVQITGGSGSFGTTITWGSFGTGIRDILRFSGTTTTFFASASAERTHLGGYYPSRSVIEDFEDDEHIGVQTTSDTAQRRGYTYSQPEGESLLLPCGDFPRTGSYNEYTALRSFIKDWCAQHKRYRYYRDATETAAFDVTTAPGGYLVRTADWSSVSRWSPIPRFEGWAKHWLHPLRQTEDSD